MRRPVLGILLTLPSTIAAQADCNLGSERRRDWSVRRMDDELLYRCWQGQWIPWPTRAIIYVVAASWLLDNGFRAQIDVSENASRECEHKPSCTRRRLRMARWPFPGAQEDSAGRLVYCL